MSDIIHRLLALSAPLDDPDLIGDVIAHIADLKRETKALKRAGYVVSMALLQSGTYHTLCDDETKASVDVFKPRLKEQSKC